MVMIVAQSGRKFSLAKQRVREVEAERQEVEWSPLVLVWPRLGQQQPGVHIEAAGCRFGRDFCN